MQICKLSDRKVLLVSPTGRAAKRLASSTGSEASTVHRALGFSPEGKGFIHNDKNPLDADIVICDEASMLDTHLAVGLLNAIKPDAHLLLVGDPDQLPSVGAGNVLNDLIRSKALPITVLKEVRRQAADSAIIGNAHRINNGEMPIISREHTGFLFSCSAKNPKSWLTWWRRSLPNGGRQILGLTQSRIRRFWRPCAAGRLELPN